MLKTACLLCITLYAVIVAWFITVAPLARRFQGSERAPWLQRRTAAYAAAVSGLLLAIAAGTVEAVRGPGSADTVADVQAADQKFYDLYTKLPVLSAADALGPATHVKGRRRCARDDRRVLRLRVPRLRPRVQRSP